MAEVISLTNTGLPLAGLAVLSVVVPRLLVPRDNRAQSVLLRGTLVAALIVFLAGIAIFAGFQLSRGADLAGAFAASPLGTLLSLAKTSALTALVWVPVMALNWLGMAQGINKRLGDDVMRQGRGKT